MSGGGSYRLEDPADPRREGERLRRQAAAVWERERAALRSAGLGPGQRLLDLGCGAGGVLERLGPELGRQPVGVDLNQQLLRQARAGAGHLVRADGARLPFADGVFDFVLLRLVLRHAPARVQLVDEAARVLAAGGVLCAVDVDEAATVFEPEPAGWPALKAALAAAAIRRGGDPFVGRRLRRLLEGAGLRGATTVGLPVSTDDLPPRAFVDTMLAPAARTIDPELLDPAAVRRGWDALGEWASEPGGFGYALGWMAAARKPDDWTARPRP